ncbi:hypothetical protein [Acidiferrobacter sp.]|jgi:hypothetical protein|uniref:hypothetical protein n=1 Tax=Acidiferrobacter sp. TaxID=1872107 RepID=UPI0026191AB3|nr:hypothetical protein [Acidiferrobacter sp.]
MGDTLNAKLDFVYKEVLGEVGDLVGRIEVLRESLPLLIEALNRATAAASVLEKAAAAVPDQIYRGAVRAGTDVKGEIEATVRAAGEAFSERLAGALIQSIKATTTQAEQSLQKAQVTFANTVSAKLAKAARAATADLAEAAGKARAVALPLGITAALSAVAGMIAGVGIVMLVH